MPFDPSLKKKRPFDVNTLVGQLISNFDSLDKNTEETASYLLKIQQVILRLAQRAKKYEEKYLPLYEIKNHFGDLWMASGGNMLLSIFEKTHEYVCSSSGNVSDDSMSSLKNELCKISSFLLNHLFDEVNKSTGDVKKSKAKQLKEIQTNIVRGLCECNRFGVAIKLAEKYRSLPSIAVAVQESQLSEIQKQEQHTNFTKIYGYDYLSLVMNWYIDHDQEEKILAFGQHTPSFVNKFFKSKTTKVSWIHYLLQEDYGNALNNLKEYLAKESNIYKRCDMLSWTRMLFVMGLEEDEDVEMDSDNETADSAIESHVLRDLSVDLEFESVQVEMIETFREHLKSMSVNDTAADFILSRHGSAIFQSEDRQEDIDQMKTSIDLLLNETSVSKLSVIRLLVMLDNSGPDVKNIITALKLIHELRDDSRSQFLQIAWKEIYRRDLRHRYVTLFDTLTETQRQSALMETFTYRVAKSNMDELITPTAFVNDFQEQELIQLENLLKAVIDSD
ncbi:hypothetical protein G6F56_006931 [Rhizopus delemar]|nr:hypothetical protein G6F56_006931 [Rhizopus delemar]